MGPSGANTSYRKVGVRRRLVLGGQHHAVHRDRAPAGVDYRLAYVAADGTVMVLYDNQAGHAPHRHIRGSREPYELTNVDRLVEDFLADVDRLRKE